MRAPRLRTAAAATAAILLAGCATTANRVATQAPDVPVASGAPALLVAQADAAHAERDPAAALSFAELAVRADPASVAARRALARYYLAAGRFRAAVEAYDDLVAMLPGDGDARLKQGVALLATGRTLAGVTAIEASGAPAADRGLALALAGEAERAAALLDGAARASGADSRLRQNLALAHALAGRWVQARTIAAQDLSPAEVDARIRGWSALAAGDAATRTRAFLAVTPAGSDAGRPVELAYRAPAEPEAPMVAEAAPAAQPVLAEAAIAPPLAAAPAVAAARMPAPILASAPVTIRTVALPPRPLASPMAAEGAWVVQLGAYPSAAVRDDTWQHLRRDNSSLRMLRPIHSSATLAKGVFYRLAVGGFAERRTATELCTSLRAAGQACFVKRMERPETSSPVRLASRN